MKKFITTLALATIAFTSSVSATNVQLRPADTSFETKVCYTAATEGLQAAYNVVRDSEENFARFTETLSCNGKSLVRTARTFYKNQNNEVEASATKVRFVTDERVESQVCLDAVMMGVDAAFEKHNMKDRNIICNDLDIRSFAKKFSGKTVAL
jgi:hypothetical protein